MGAADPDGDFNSIRLAVARARLKATYGCTSSRLSLLALFLLLVSGWTHKCYRCSQLAKWRIGGGKGVGGSQGFGQDLEADQFLYVYDFGTEYTEDVLKLVPAWYSVQYDAEKTLTRLWTRSNRFRTMDPEKASLFLVPFYSARYTLYHYKDAQINMREAVEETSKIWGRLLRRVRHEFPYFNRSNGRDHFSVLTMDHGRCTALTFLHPSVYGEMFFLQLNGDKMVRSNHASTNRSMQALTYTYGAPSDPSLPDIPCYMADRDVVIPPMARLPLRDPWKTVKNITALFRFSPGQHHGVPIPHHGHLLRKELYDLWKERHIPGWDFGVKSEADTDDEWRRAKFCIAPPGHSQWTSRPLKSILSGCIPVTFYREHDSPWQEELEYGQMSINIGPDELHTLRERLESVMADPPKLEEMQRTIVGVQEYFRWSGELESGVEAHIMRRLQQRAKRLRSSVLRMRSIRQVHERMHLE